MVESDRPKTFLLLCDCGRAEHQAILTYWPDEEELPEQLIYVQIHLRAWEGFFRRLWTGLRYAFGHRSRYGDWDEIVLNKATVLELQKFIGEYLEASNGKA